MERLWEAMQDVEKTQGRLGKADFQLGRTWYILRKSGYGEILSKKCGCTKHNGVTESNSHLFPKTDNLFTIPGRSWFTVRLDWIDSVTITCKCISLFWKNLGALELSRTAKQEIVLNWYDTMPTRLIFFFYTTMPHRAADESTTSQSKKSQRLTMENDAPSLERESTLLMILSVATTLQRLEFRPGYRPARCPTKLIKSWQRRCNCPASSSLWPHSHTTCQETQQGSLSRCPHQQNGATRDSAQEGTSNGSVLFYLTTFLL